MHGARYVFGLDDGLRSGASFTPQSGLVQPTKPTKLVEFSQAHESGRILRSADQLMSQLSMQIYSSLGLHLCLQRSGLKPPYGLGICNQYGNLQQQATPLPTLTSVPQSVILFERTDKQLHCLTSCDHTLFWQAPNSWSKLPCNTAPDTPSHPASQMWQVNLEEQELWLVV